MRRKAKPLDMLTEEEKDVQKALLAAGYESIDTAPGEVSVDDFTPTAILYRVYRQHVAQFSHPFEDVEILSYRKFGSVMARVFPHLEDQFINGRGRLTREYRARRSYHGERCWGYLGIKGPESIKSYSEAGRPRHERDPHA